MVIAPIQIINRAVLAGICGGLLAALFIAVVAEQSIDAAIAIEDAARAQASALSDQVDNAEPLVSRQVQVFGGLVAAVLYGALIGVVFGTVFTAVRHRIRAADDFRRSLLLAAAAFVAVVFVPALKYPANPPAVGDPETIGQRTWLYLTFVAASLVLLFALGLAYTQMRERFDQPTSVVLAVIAAVVGFVALMVIWPDSPDSVAPTFPASLLWRFRMESVATLALVWSGLGLGLGWLLARLQTNE